MSSNIDFLSSDDSDLNLDLLLGEYTASDVESEDDYVPAAKTAKLQKLQKKHQPQVHTNRLGKIESGELNSVDTVTDVQQFVPRFQNQYSDYRRPPYRTPRRFMNRPNRNYNNVQNRQKDGGQEYQQNSRAFHGNCYKCGKQGHRQWECRSKDIENTISTHNEEVKLDTQSKNLKHTSDVKCDVTCEFETESDTDCELDISINYPLKINAHSIDGETHNANEVNTEQEIVLEPPMPRRSARRRKKPEWHSFYQMNQMSVRESLPETKYVLVNLISSGVLQGVSETMVSRIVNTILDVG
ncbi:unnamed protein product [Mytilus coruscus]|uniref:CCHC-type domain-containing protein n=1 Tax=Mytilus coruscus TaxID=42192 RepID=A0A6J8B9A3_MYTCO|nr:unnamed protein product [Mytilus coruscus]